MQHGHLEQAEQFRRRIMPHEAEVAVVRRDSGDESERPDEDEDDSDHKCPQLHGRPAGGGTAAVGRFAVTGRTADIA